MRAWLLPALEQIFIVFLFPEGKTERYPACRLLSGHADIYPGGEQLVTLILHQEALGGLLP